MNAQSRLQCRGLLLVLTAFGLSGKVNAGGPTDEERLLHSDGSWHRAQRKNIAFESSCYYTQEPELPYGCQYSQSKSDAWMNNAQRSEQKGALLDLYRQTQGSRWRAKDNWHQDSDPCWDAWYGVTCDEHGHVIALELTDNGLLGALPASLGKLTSLVRLDLSTSAPGYHAHPNVHANKLSGELPSFAEATQLEEIEISGNEIEALDEELWKTGGSLRVLSANHNLLTALPKNMRRFQVMHTLELSHNRITDLFPDDFGFLSNLQIMHLEYNQLQGQIQSTIKGMHSVRIFNVAHNPSLGGELPEDIIVEWQKQEYLAIMNTSIAGYIASLCYDMAFCWKYMYDTHKDLTWATPADVPDIVDITLDLAR